MKTSKAKLFGGPLHGTIVDIPAGSEVYRIGRFFTYTYAGRAPSGTLLQFAMQPKSRFGRRMLFGLIGRRGDDPRVMAEAYKQEPKVGKTDKRGQGAQRRAAKREAARG